MSEYREKNVSAEAQEPVSVSSTQEAPLTGEEPKQPWWKVFLEPGSAPQIIFAALLAIGIGVAVSATVDKVPEAARVILGIPGNLWLRALRATVLPLIVCAMILAVQRLREISRGGQTLARWCVGWYVGTTILVVGYSTILVAFVWSKMFKEVGEDVLNTDGLEGDKNVDAAGENPPHMVVQTLFYTFIPQNIFSSLATDDLLAILITSVVVGYLIKDPRSYLLKIVVELEEMITRVIGFLIKLAPIGVFFLILSNIMRLNIADIGENLGYLIGGTLSTMAIHMLVVIPILVISLARVNPYTYMIKSSRALITAWGTASSAATMPVTLSVAAAHGIPKTIYKFSVPLGTLINMDGTAIYFPFAVVFMAATQGQTLQPTDYVIVILLSTLAAIGTTPIPSSSLVLTLMICNAIDVQITGMYAVILAIDWFIDRFRTAINVYGDLSAAICIYKQTGIEDPEEDIEETVMASHLPADNRV